MRIDQVYIKTKVNDIKIKTYICSTLADCDKAIYHIKREIINRRIIGVDTEWVKKTEGFIVVLLQLAVENRCYLIRLSVMPVFPQSVKELLEDESVLKVGCAIENDAEQLFNSYKVEMKCCLDIVNLARKHGYRKISLKSISEQSVGILLVKNKNITCSDWSASCLSKSQIRYAVADAVAPLRVLLYFHEEDMKSNNLILTNEEEKVEHLLRSVMQYMVLLYHSKGSSRQKPDFKYLKKKMMCIKGYYAVLDVHGEKDMGLCTEKVKRRLVEDKLAVVVKDKSKTIQLIDDSSFMECVLIKNCIVCGLNDKLVIAKIIPNEYYSYFPGKRGGKHFTNSAVLCVDCNCTLLQYKQLMRLYLSVLCAAPFNGIGKVHVSKVKTECKNLASRLLNTKRHTERLFTTRMRLSSFMQAPLTEELLHKLANENPCSGEKVSHAELVVNYFLERDKINKFRLLWIDLFFEFMDPKYLSKEQTEKIKAAAI